MSIISASPTRRQVSDWDEIKMIEPLLASLENRVRSSRPPLTGPEYMAVLRFWLCEIPRLAGDRARRPELRGPAFLVAEREILHAFQDAAVEHLESEFSEEAQ